MPLIDLRVIARQQNIGDVPTTPRPWLRVPRPLQQPLRERIFLVAAPITKDTRNQTNNCFSHDQHSNLTADQNIVADRHFLNAIMIAGVVENPLVNALITAAGENEVVFLG